MNQPELKPCPFCGCAETRLMHYPEDEDPRQQRQCLECLAVGPHEDGPKGINPNWGWQIRAQRTEPQITRSNGKAKQTPASAMDVAREILGCAFANSGKTIVIDQPTIGDVQMVAAIIQSLLDKESFDLRRQCGGMEMTIEELKSARAPTAPDADEKLEAK